LRVLHHYTDKQIDSYVLNLAEITEIRILPQYKRIDQRKEYKNIALSTLEALREMNMIKENNNEIQSIRISA
jgi:hypothetical protein